MAKRTKIPQETVDKIMVLCKRKCCWCEDNEATEIHHINKDPSNNEEDNLFPCCPICQKKFHANMPMARKITENELKMRRDNFYSQTSDYKPQILNKLEKLEYSIEILREELIRK